jgi:hypothetical protein
LDKPLIKYATSGHSIFATGNVQETSEAFHVRKGEVNGYFDYLNEVDVKYLQTQIKDTFSKWYGYRDATSPETFA